MCGAGSQEPLDPYTQSERRHALVQGPGGGGVCEDDAQDEPARQEEGRGGDGGRERHGGRAREAAGRRRRLGGVGVGVGIGAGQQPRVLGGRAGGEGRLGDAGGAGHVGRST